MTRLTTPALHWSHATNRILRLPVLVIILVSRPSRLLLFHSFAIKSDVHTFPPRKAHFTHA